MKSRAPRLIAGATVLLILIALGVFLLPPYTRYWQLQSYVSDLADNSATSKLSEAVVKKQIVNKAAALGLAVNSDDVHVAISEGAVKIDVLYIVQVNVAGYAVDLHFRPAAGA